MTVEKITVAYVNTKIGDHLTKHDDVYWPLLSKHEKTLYGPDGDNGLCFDVREIKKGFKTIEKLGYTVIVTFLLDFVTRVFSIGK